MLEAFHAFVKPCNVMVDIGCGIRPYFNPDAKIQVCIEPFQEYINIAKEAYSDSNIVFINKYALEGVKSFPDNSVDTVVMLDLIEHLEKNEGYELIKEADRITKKQIVIYTPLGFLSNHREGKDAWGLNGQELQEHKSGWLPEDFDLDWEFHICENFHLKDAENSIIDHDHGCLWAIKNKTDIQQEQIKIPNIILPEVYNRRFVMANKEFSHKLEQVRVEANKELLHKLEQTRDELVSEINKTYKELLYKLYKIPLELIPFKNLRSKLKLQLKSKIGEKG